LDILENEGADLTQLAVGHIVPRPDNLGVCQQLAKRGCYIEFDLFGSERWSLMDDLIHTDPEVQISSIKGFVDNDLVDHVLISQNVCHVEQFTVNGGDGYVHILKNLVPKFKRYGVTDDQIQRIMIRNPKTLFPFRSHDQ
jgi:phosphotriesterase-related protein